MTSVRWLATRFCSFYSVVIEHLNEFHLSIFEACLVFLQLASFYFGVVLDPGEDVCDHFVKGFNNVWAQLDLPTLQYKRASPFSVRDNCGVDTMNPVIEVEVVIGMGGIPKCRATIDGHVQQVGTHVVLGLDTLLLCRF